MADASVRPARPADVGEIARIQLSTWRTAYAGLLPPTALEAVTDDVARSQWEDAIGTPPTARHRVLVAVEGPMLVGFAAVEPDAESAAAGVIGTLLVEPRWGRRGHASRLLAAVVDLARADGWRGMTTWVVDGDAVSAAFYESAGWARDGWVRTLDTGAGTIQEARLHTSLADDATTEDA